MKKTTLYQQSKALAMNLEGISKHGIAMHLSLTRSTIEGIFKRYRGKGRVEDQPCIGRPCLISECDN